MQKQSLLGSTANALGDVGDSYKKQSLRDMEKIKFTHKDKNHKPNQKEKASVKYNF
jgi:hypothetical protein